MTSDKFSGDTFGITVSGIWKIKKGILFRCGEKIRALYAQYMEFVGKFSRFLGPYIDSNKTASPSSEE